MLEIDIPDEEFFDESTNELFEIKAIKLRFEHSLVSISKWESKWKKPFLHNDTQKTNEEMIDYIRCMCLTQNVDPIVFKFLPKDAVDKLVEYMQDSHTATWFNEKNTGPTRKKIITSELIYFWMTQYGIWKECEKWHINRLLTLIHVCSAETAPSKKMSKSEVYDRQRALNQARRKPKVPH